VKVLSIRQPWCWAIVHEGKDVENRTWYTPYRGPFLIHAAKTRGRSEQADARWIENEFGVVVPKDLPFGGIVGQATIVDCVRKYSSPWAFGPWCFILEQAKPLPFQPVKGQLGFFDV
jgi:hypothetical protein